MGFGIREYLRANMDNPDNQYFPFSALTGQSSDVPDEEEEEEEEKEYQEFHKFLDEIFGGI